MTIKKSDLYSSLWQSCDELRGGMDASQYKDYVLFMLFIKYVTDKYGTSDDFAPPVTIPDGASFTDMLELRGRIDVGDRINTQVIAPLVHANARLALSDFPDFNDPNKLGEGNEMVERLTNLINIFANPDLDFSRNRAEHDDILGDAYEYLMRHFATESGKSKGQFYTPAEVSRVIARTIGISPENAKGSTTAYDPTCGSGSLLLKVAAQAGKRITLEGQEKDVTTAGLARMNMILHDFPTATIVSGNTLAAPKFKDRERLRTYDYVVANPPFSDKTWTTGLTPATDPYQRFAWGEPPAKQGDYAYLLHIIRSMKATGKAACVLPHGVLFRGHAEATIRVRLVRSGYLRGIIGLPPNLFFGTGIPACIVVLDKENAAGRKGVFMIDAARGFTKDGPKNRLREQDIHRIVDTFERQADVARYARMVPFDEIADPRNDFNLNLPRYVDSTQPEELQDIDGHLRGGIPERDVDALNEYWRLMPGLRGILFESAGRAGYARLKPPLADVKRTILEHTEFSSFRKTIVKVFAEWRRDNKPTLTGFGEGGHPKALNETISEALLATFRPTPLLDAYDVYQHLMDYWAESMQDDAYLIAAHGWVNGAQPREILRVKGKNGRLVWPEPHDYLKGKRRFKSDLVPASILVARHFPAEHSALSGLDDELLRLEQRLAQMREEGAGEDGLLAEVIEDTGRSITARAVRERRKEIDGNPLYADELTALREYAECLRRHASVRTKRNAEQKILDEVIDAKYPELTEQEVKTLVVEDKWMAQMSAAVDAEIESVSQSLASRVRDLAERYAASLPRLIEEVDVLSARVQGHLRTMQRLLAGELRLPGFRDRWKVRRLGDHATFLRNGVNSRAELLPEGPVKYVHYGDVHASNDVYLSTASLPSLPAAKAASLDRLLPGDLILADASEDLEGIGKSVEVKEVGDAELVSGLHTIAVRFDKDVLADGFKGFLQFSPMFVSHLRRLAAGTKVYATNRAHVASVEMPLPSVLEQNAIAGVLSDVDADIAALEARCAKMKTLKQAMMQELLTGKTRLVSPRVAHG